MQRCNAEFGSEYEWSANEAFLLSAGQGELRLKNAQKFRSGRDALKAVARTCKDRYTRVLLPALCCESMVSPFAMHGLELAFYRLRSDYTADMEDVNKKLAPNTILLYGSYFGIAPFSAGTLEKLREAWPAVLFLEDRTQDLLYIRDNAFVPDVTIASFRKWTAIGDGALLWSENAQFLPNKTEPEFARIREEAMQLKASYLQTGETQTKDTYRQMLNTASDMLDATADAYAMTEDSVKLLEQLDLAKMFAKRQENVRVLETAFENAENLKRITPVPQNSTLYYPVLVDDQAMVQTKLAQMGIYCPVLWPVPQEAIGVCPIAEYTAAHMLGLPCDHRYSPEDMDYIAGQVMRVVNEK